MSSNTAVEQAAADQKVATQPGVIAVYARAIGRALQHRGIDPEPIFRAVGLPANVSNDPMVRMSSATTLALYEACVAATNDPYFGLTVGRLLQASNIHALGHGLLASRHLLDACLRLERYFAVASQSAAARVERGETEVALRFKHLVEVSGHSEDACLAFVHGLMRALHHADFGPLRVEFRHACPAAGAGPYEELFGVTPAFEQAETALVWPAAEMLSPLSGDCLELAQSNDQLAAEYLARIDRGDVTARVRALILESMASGDCTRGRVAATMCMSEANLHLKLAQRGISFNELLDATRQEVAMAQLSRSALSITEVAFMLGFTDASNFSRAFKRWTGRSPSSYRSSAGARGLVSN